MIVATRYAKSLIDLSIEKQQLDATRSDMKLIKQVCETNRDFVLLLNSPTIKPDKKQEIFNSVFSGKITALSLSFINLLSKKRREFYIPSIAKQFDEQYKVKNNIITAVVTSSIDLDSDSKKRILDIIKESGSNTNVELIERINPSIVGGFILSIGDKQIDQSVKRKLSDLKKNLANKN
jgi:F-type H+-transporting ATPase subunit delta